MGNRIVGWGIIRGPEGTRAVELTPGLRRLMAKRLIPERPTTAAVTRHLRINHVRR